MASTDGESATGFSGGGSRRERVPKKSDGAFPWVVEVHSGHVCEIVRVGPSISATEMAKKTLSQEERARLAEIKEEVALGALGGIVVDGNGNKWVKLEEVMSGGMEANEGDVEATECFPGYIMCWNAMSHVVVAGHASAGVVRRGASSDAQEITRHEAGTVLSIEGNQPGVVDMSGNKWLRLSDSPYYIMSFDAGVGAHLLRLSEEIDLERSRV
jgi:hypothetical protein